MKEILDKLNLSDEIKKALVHTQLTEAIYNQEQQVIQATLKTKSALPYAVYKTFLRQLQLYLMCEVQLSIEAETCQLDFSNLHQYFNQCVRQEKLQALRNVTLQMNGDIKLLCLDEKHQEEVEREIPHLEKRMKQCGIALAISALTKVHKVEAVELPASASGINRNRPTPQAAPAQKFNNFQNYRPKRKRHAKEDYDLIPLHLLRSDQKKVAVEGEVFMLDIRDTRSGNKLVKYGIHDGQGAIMALEFLDDMKWAMEKGQSVRVYGDYEYEDKYDHDYIFQIHQHEVIEPLFLIEDKAEEKRIEFHLHTNKSEMDGVSSVSEYLDQAYAWGHEGFIITDHTGVQAFPQAHRHLKGLKKKYPDHPFKLGYGVEMNLVDERLAIVTNPHQEVLHQGNYVVFDLETTGLSAHFDHIIEFGAVRITNGRTVDKMQMFIKPPTSIRAFIQDLTNITDNDVKDALMIDEAIDQILDFIGDDVLVAHNAGFDMNFLQENLRRLNRPELENAVIDTLDLSRALFENRRSYRLGSIARHLKIAYDEGVAHRADYDAEVLSLVFLEMLRNPLLQDFTVVDELMQLSDENGFAKVRKNHANVIAKNQEGLKELYQLVSISHTEYLAFFGKTSKAGEEFMAEPRIVKDELNKRRDNLLIGAGCTESEVFESASNDGDKKLEQVIAFYDYIEIMPLELYGHLIERGTIENEARLKEIIMRIIKMAEKLNKPIIATANVHYNHPNQKVIRDVYIHSQGIGGTRHPLFIFNQERRLAFESPKQHYRTTTEMLDNFAYLGEDKAYEYVVDNPKQLFSILEEVSPLQKKLFTPSLENSDEKLTELVYGNAEKLYGNPLPELVQKRLDREMKSILGHGYGVIYYISHLLVKKSLQDGYLVGSRGSVGSSFAATMAEITEVNPLAPHYVCPKCHYNQFFLEAEAASGYDLEEKNCPKCGRPMIAEGQDIPFETFLGFEGDKVPDIDLNFSGEYQEYAHAYTKELFGEKYVYRAGTISTVAAKTAYGYVLGYHESIGEEASNKAWNEYLAQGAEGVKRTSGQHPGGIIVIPNSMDVHDFTPIQYPANNPESAWYTTHFEFHDIEDNVLKLDILGHVDPTAMKMLERLTGVDVTKVPMNDPKTMSLFNSTEALGVDERKYLEKTGGLGLPEFGTPFVRRMLEATLPEKFSDLVRISGLSHGTDVWANNAETLIKEQGLTLDEVIGCRDDIMVYLMQYGLPHKTSFDIMESVRRGRGLTDEWITIMKDHNVPNWYIDSCKKIKYMFPKAHAAAYVMMAVRVAWFKVYYPRAYYAVYFTLRVNAYEIETMTARPETIAHRLNSIQQRLNNFETKRDVSMKEKNLIDTLEVSLEMNHRGFKINPISLEHSDATEFILDPHDETAILPPFNVVDGLGNNVAQNLVKARDEQMFISKEDMMRRGGVSGTLIQKLDELKVTDHLQESNQMSLF